MADIDWFRRRRITVCPVIILESLKGHVSNLINNGLVFKRAVFYP